jgi:dolichol kinase
MPFPPPEHLLMRLTPLGWEIVAGDALFDVKSDRSPSSAGLRRAHRPHLDSLADIPHQSTMVGRAGLDNELFVMARLSVSMDKGHILRRLVHMLAPLSLVYYFLPDPLWSGAPSNQVMLLFLFEAILIFEALRLYFGWHIIGIRYYEYDRISAAAWAALAMVVALLFFPLQLAAPAIIGMAFVDPLIGELRRHKSKLYPSLPTVVYFLLTFTILWYFFGPTTVVILAAAVATGLAIGIERVRTKYIDDDFLMTVVPLLGMAVVFLISSSYPS